MSNSAAVEWCANAGAALTSKPIDAIKSLILILFTKTTSGWSPV
jgi:hypothetical protein